MGLDHKHGLKRRMGGGERALDATVISCFQPTVQYTVCNLD
jgi:hypothetical protein